MKSKILKVQFLNILKNTIVNMNKYLEKIATELKEPVDPKKLGIDLSKGEEKELYKWLTAVTLFSKPIQRSVAAKASMQLSSEGLHSPDAIETAGWDELRDALIRGHYGRFDESTATRLLHQAKHLKTEYGTLTNLLDSRTPEEIREEIQSFNGIGPLGGQLFIGGVLPHLDVYQNKYMKKVAFDMSTYQRHKYVEKDWSHLENPVGSLKRDGAHFVISYDENGVPKIFSRRPSVKGGHPERSAQLPQLSKPMPEYAGDNVTVELVHTGKTKSDVDSHPTVSGILNSKKERSLNTQAELGPVRAVLLDARNHNLPTFKDKLEYLKKFEQAYGDPEVMFSQEQAIGPDAIRNLLTRTRQQGLEGAIVTDLNLPEEQNVRYKIKNFNTYNLKVTGQHQEIDIHGKPKDSMGALEVVDATGRMVGKVGTGFLRDERIGAWKDPWTDRLIQVRAYPPSKPGGQIRFPIYNGDADGELDTVS